MFDKQNIIAIGCDHGGFEMKNYLLKTLTNQGFQWFDFGTF